MTFDANCSEMFPERTVRFGIAPIALLSFLTSVVVMAIAASLEAHWSSVGFPSNSYRDRERLLLVAGIWGTIVSREFTIFRGVKMVDVADLTRPRQSTP